ncbi:FAD-dependent monooxygenase [Massilia sp. LXY-6]|uniref:FAD-dependent monooxygenase n=1 Tax=Massilia sp. LXY-6 TaxID=3379823 RepID=UPI003EDF1157
MKQSPTKRDDVLIAGAGPTGLVLALWLTRQGVGVRIVDKAPGPGITSRAVVVHARTLELYRQLGLAAEVIEAGMPNPGINLWVRGKRRAHITFGDAGADLTPYPFILVFPQDRHERVLIERLEQMGVTVERETELAGFEQHADHVRATLRGPDGIDTCEARWLAGCDGAHSPVRHVLGAGFEGGTYDQLFYVADVIAGGPAADGQIHLSLDDADFLALFSYTADGQARLIGSIREDRVDPNRPLTFDDVGERAIHGLGVEVRQVNWFSTYKVHHRLSDHFRHGRVFLLGDAAHIHSPAGGQGMNTGIGDAINLAWKLKAVLHGDASDRLLDSYEAERMAFARTLVETTDRVFTFVSAESSFANFVRTRIAPSFVSAAYTVDAVREFMFRLVSQCMLNYHGSPLSSGAAGKVKGGDRLPWAAGATVDNYAPTGTIDWQVHVYGATGDPLENWCHRVRLPLHVFGWERAHERAGLARDAAYLVRPDGYVALAEATGKPEALQRYFHEIGYQRFG